MRGILAGIALACLMLAPAHGADDKGEASPFIYAQSALAPAPSRGWVVLRPGESELAYDAIRSHYEKTALLLNANGFDTLIVPYEEAYDDDLDGDVEEDGDRIAAVTTRALHWMERTHVDAADKPGAIVAWGEGARGLWTLAATGSKYPIANLAAGAALYPAIGEASPFSSRLPILVQAGEADETAAGIRRYLMTREPGSVEPEVVLHEGASHAFDIERFTKPMTVRSMPLIGASVTFAYNAQAAREADQKILTFLKARLEAPE